MSKRRIAERGDVYWIDPNPVKGREMKDRHRFVVITPRKVNALGVVMTVPVTSAGAWARDMGIVVVISGHDTTGVAVCNQVRSFDLEARERDGTVRFIESIDVHTSQEIADRVIALIEPAT